MDEDFTLWLHAYVDEEDIALLPADRQEHGYANWGHPTSYPTSQWMEGVIYRSRTIQDTAPVSYQLIFGVWSPEGETRLATVDDPKGAVDLGWHRMSVE